MVTPRRRVLGLTAAAMLAFAANSILCRLALRDTGIDPAGFTALRLASGAIVLWLVVRLRGGRADGGNWRSAWALFAYAAAFSFAYVWLPAGHGGTAAVRRRAGDDGGRRPYGWRAPA